MTETSPLLTDIAAFLEEVSMAETTFGRLSINDGKLVPRLRLGGDVTTRTEQKIRDFMIARRAAKAA